VTLVLQQTELRLPRQGASLHTTSKPVWDELAPFLKINMRSWGNRETVM